MSIIIDKNVDLASLPMQPIDPRIKLLSYSSRLLLHSCPRKYQLYRLNAETSQDDEDIPASVTFAFGTVVGVGIQYLLQNPNDLDGAILAMFQQWEPDLLADNPKQKKSFFLAVFAVQQFADICKQGYLEDYELVRISSQQLPAIELSFCIDLEDGFQYRGYVDAVLQHTLTGEVVVLELKTTAAASVNSATYKNSSQAIGYSVVLDQIFPNLSSYQVLYLVYSTKSQSYEQLPFEKSLLQRALWLQELLLEKETILLYEDTCYPMYGESCFNWYRECEYLGLCTLSTERLVSGTYQPKEEPEYTYYLTFDELVESQIAKGDTL